MKSRILVGLFLAINMSALIAHVKSISTDMDHDMIVRDKQNAVIKFYAPWCGVCTSIKNDFEHISNKADYANISFYEVNIDDSKSLASKHSIIGVPTIICIRDGVEVKRIVGVKNTKTFMDDLAKLFNDVFKK
jgi:thioredoxin 1